MRIIACIIVSAFLALSFVVAFIKLAASKTKQESQENAFSLALVTLLVTGLCVFLKVVL